MTRPNSLRKRLNRAISAPRFMDVSPQESPPDPFLVPSRVLGPFCLSVEQSSTLVIQTWRGGPRRRTEGFQLQSRGLNHTSRDSLVGRPLRTGYRWEPLLLPAPFHAQDSEHSCLYLLFVHLCLYSCSFTMLSC